MDSGQYEDAKNILHVYSKEKFGDFDLRAYPNASNNNDSYHPLSQKNYLLFDVTRANGSKTSWNGVKDVWDEKPHVHAGANAWILIAAARYLLDTHKPNTL